MPTPRAPTPLRRRAGRVATWALLLAVATCTDGLSPDKPWITPMGQVTSDPPELLVGAGDIAGCTQTNDEATALLLDAIPGTVFTIGDNAYENGTSAQYTNCYQPTWGRHKARTKPAPGNHEYNTANATGYFGYYGAVAGDPTQGYYSYNLGEWHIIVLNSSGGTAGTNVSMSASSAQMQWLRADLAANPRLCTLAYWHHPLYQSTSGTGTGGLTDTKSRAVWDTLYARGAELVLGGHRHFYERLAPQKPDKTPDPAFGIRHITVGTGGNFLHASTNVVQNSEVRSSNTYGVLKLWLYADSYAWKFVPVAGSTFSDSGSTACHAAPGSGSAVSPSQSTLAAAPTTLTAGSGSATITVTAKDASGNPISGSTVVLAATGTGNTLTQPSGPTNASGVATGTLSSTVAQAKTVSATANGTGITQTASVTVSPGPVSAAQSTVAAAPTSIAAGTGTSTITVTAKDANGNAISGATVVLAATGSGNTLTQPSGATNASGVATGTLSSTVAESKTVSATISGTAVTQTASLTVTVGAVSAAQSTVAAAPTTLTAGSGSATITVTVKDASGNPISGATVVLAASGTGNTLTQPSGPTNASGVATGTLSSTVAQAKTISATANGVAITQAASVTVNPGPVSASQSTVAAAPTSIPTGTETSTITVTAKDANGNLISGATVVLAATGSGNTLTQPSGPTDASGVATGTLSSTVAEAKTVSATINGTAVTQGATVTVTVGSPSAALSTVAASPTALTAGSGSATITVTVQDANGNPISGATVVLAASGTGNTLTQPSGPTDASGVATGTLSSTVAQVKTVSATANGTGITQTASVSVTAGPVSAAQSAVAAAPASIAVGTGTSTITVTAKDANGNLISGATVVLAATGSGNTLTQPSGPTDASGVATGTLGSTVAEAKTVAATIDGTAVTQTAAVTVTPAPVSASQSTVAASPTALTAGSGSATITVTVQDASGNPISGATVVLAATGSGNTLTQPSGTTDASGVATGTLSSTVAQAKIVSATANGVAITQTAAVTVNPGPVSAAQSTVGATPTSIDVGTGTSTITVTAMDANGNPISGATVVLAATGSGNTLTQPSSPTNASGVATGSLSSTVAETKTVSATIDGTAITQTASVTVTVGSPSPALSTVAASPTSFIAGSGSSTITVTVRDASGNPIRGATVVLAATGAGNTLTQPHGPTRADGVAEGTLSSTSAGTKAVSATADGVPITQNAYVSVSPGPVSSAQSSVAASPSSIIAGSGSTTISVTARDANGNPISGATVVLSATGTGNSLTQPAGPTNASGVATGTLSSTVPETKTVSATIDGAEVTQTAIVTVSSAPVSASQSTVAASPTSLVAGTGSATLTATVQDADGNPISGATVVFTATGSGNTLTQPSGTTDASGVATGTLSSTVAGSKVVSATANGTAITQTAAVTVTAGSVSAAQSTVAAAPASLVAGTGASTITVTARDENGNPISGATVVLAATGSGNTLTQPAGPTNASGVATGTLSSIVAEAKTVSATINGTAVTQSATVTVTVGAPSAALSTVAASPSSLTAGSGSATITVTVQDGSGNPISGATVVLAATGSGNTLTQPSGTTDASGVATGSLSSTVAQAKTVSATANGVAITQTAAVTVNAGPVSGAQSTVAAAPASITAGSGASTITVTAKDASGNPISGATVALAATGSGNVLTQPSATTNASGVATGTLSSTVAEAKTVSATVNGTAITQTAAVTVNPTASSVVLAGAANVSSCGNTRDEASATLLDAIPGSVILIGSGAFPDGSATAYANCYSPSWGRHKARTYPTPGNQDYQTPGATGYFGYFGTQAGDPTKGYYSFDLADWHIIVLNTGNEATVSYGLGSAQELWLKADLAANTKLCTMAVLHNTRWFSSSTAGWFSSSAAKALWNDLYAAGADVVLSGRLYHYERMAPQDGNAVRDDARGIRQFNVGVGGYSSTLPTFIAPNSEVVSAAYGVLKLNLAANSYTWEFVPIPGSTFTDSGSGTCH